MLEHFDADGVIEFAIGAGKPRGGIGQFPVRQSAAVEKFEAAIVHLQPHPFVSRVHQSRAKCSRAASNINDRTPR